MTELSALAKKKKINKPSTIDKVAFDSIRIIYIFVILHKLNNRSQNKNKQNKTKEHNEIISSQKYFNPPRRGIEPRSPA